MIIYYPTYYLVPVVPVMFLEEVDYRDDINFQCSMDVGEVQNTYSNMDKNIYEDTFAGFDEEYVNESKK
ncbi:MAG: hypothetical protein N2B06_14745 [Clostridium sp.]